MKRHLSSRKSKIRAALLCAALLLVLLAGVGVYMYMTRYWLPMRPARPILALLADESTHETARLRIYGMRIDKSGNLARVQDHTPLRGIAAEKVKQAVLRELAAAREPAAIDSWLWLVSRTQYFPERVGFRFEGEADWDVIRQAVAKTPRPPKAVFWYEVRQKDDGTYYLAQSGGIRG